MDDAAVRATLDAVWRIESGHLVGGLARLVRDVGLAEELAQDALVLALERWPREGVPERPGAWLAATARNRALDHLRRARHGTPLEEGGAELLPARDDAPAELAERLDDELGDDLLRLMFATCHPVLAPEGRVALTLRLLGGLSAAEIARAMLVPEPTVAQRIVRAKRALAEARVDLELPRGAELATRLTDVLAVIYLVFNEGHAASAGERWTRPELCEEALRLGRILAARMPDEPEAQALLALMELQASRLRARVGPRGEPVLLLEQDRSRWDWLAIARGLAALERSRGAAAARRLALGSYALQAELAACHARARRAADTDWARIAALYGELARLTPSPIVELNRAVAIARVHGPAAGLALVDALRDEPAVARYHLVPSVRAELLLQLGRRAEARAELERAVSLAGNERERELLRARAARCAREEPDPRAG